MSSAAGSEHFLHSLQVIQSKRLFEAACITVIVYNYALTFESELQLIWKSPWKLGKFLFLFTRYLGVLSMGLILYNDQSQYLSLDQCKSFSQTTSSINLCEFFIAEIILAVRLWAVWGKSKYIAWILVAGGLIPGPVLLIYYFTQVKYLNSKPDLTIYNSVGFCPGFLVGLDSMVHLFTYLLVFEIAALVIFLLTTWKALQICPVQTCLVYNLVITASSCVNIAVRLKAPEYGEFSLAFQVIMHSLGTSHMLLNMQKQALAPSHPSSSATQLGSLRFAPVHSVSFVQSA
ncbi:hypothetical protein D9758_018376 [Tetrapyrgos nigripes]|uniref:DUF6533 domain-containing protein n=1 Tax=Tetrapyrgos nigripes TaxID=182062 RepID=A0A8H5F1E9_9AGAR|nr:hypothetical protein D9758_018376 [Tetrapyrgos nigripes]